MRATLLLIGGLFVWQSWTNASAARASERPAAGALEALPRTLPPGAPLPCEGAHLPLVRYSGEHLHYQKPLQVHPQFGAHLPAWEALVSELATRHYGRPPRRIVHLGGFSCRRMRRYPDWVSEHALGNAIDVAGFDFAPLARGQTLPAGLPRALRGAFQVRLERHWNGRGANAPHAEFLRALARALIARPDLFSVVLGPAWPGHKNHFHLDRAPYRVVEVFTPGEAHGSAREQN
jgi:hypothetical protein